MKKNIRETFNKFSFETMIEFSETAITVKGKQDLAEYYIDLFFQRTQSRGQIFIRALLVKAQIVAINGH